MHDYALPYHTTTCDRPHLPLGSPYQRPCGSVHSAGLTYIHSNYSYLSLCLFLRKKKKLSDRTQMDVQTYRASLYDTLIWSSVPFLALCFPGHGIIGTGRADPCMREAQLHLILQSQCSCQYPNTANDTTQSTAAQPLCENPL